MRWHGQLRLPPVPPPHIVHVAEGESIGDAIAAISDESAWKRYRVKIGAGSYALPAQGHGLTCASHIDLSGDGSSLSLLTHTFDAYRQAVVPADDVLIEHLRITSVDGVAIGDGLGLAAAAWGVRHCYLYGGSDALLVNTSSTGVSITLQDIEAHTEFDGIHICSLQALCLMHDVTITREPASHTTAGLLVIATSATSPDNYATMTAEDVSLTLSYPAGVGAPQESKAHTIVAATGGSIEIRNATITGTVNSSKACVGVQANANSVITLRNCTITTANEGSGDATDLVNNGGTLNVDADCTYATSTGTITEI